MRRLEWIVLLLGIAALFIDPIYPSAGPRLERDKTHPAPAAGNFIEGGISPATDMVAMPSQLEFLGSWTPANSFRGEYRTIWFRAERKIKILVAGWPSASGNRLEIEFELPSGEARTIAYPGPDPGARWLPWRAALPADAKRVRIRARGESAGADRWLAFSVPCSVPLVNWALWLPLLKIVATFALAWSLLCGPGLAWITRQGRPSADLVLAIFPGPLVLVVLGLVVWALDGRFSGPLVARCGIGLILGGLMWDRLTSPVTWFRREWVTIIAGAALVAGFGAAKANVSLGPPVELYGGMLSRTLEVGGHSDSRIPYSVVQVAARHLSPFSPDAKMYFSPYSYGSRGPFSGWLATPLVVGTGGMPPVPNPESEWRPFDAQGFVTFRITAIVLAALCGWAVWGVAYGLGGIKCAQYASGLVLLAPFFAHEVYFTWPKLISAGCVLASFHLLRGRRSGLAGVALSIGYFFHPAVLLSAPFLACWILGDASLGSVRSRLGQAVRLAAVSALVALPWYLFGRWDPHAISQDTFLSYFYFADTQPAVWATWWLSRWNNFANTFIPGYVALFNSDASSYNSHLGPSGGWVHYGLLYWNTLPFAVGLPAFAVLVAAFFRGLRKYAGVMMVTVIAPSLWLIVYWGSEATGLMRQCGHVLFVTGIVLTAWMVTAAEKGLRGAWSEVVFWRWFIALRCVDLLIMAFGPALQNGWEGDARRYLANDLISLAAAIACVIGTGVLVARAPAVTAASEANHGSPPMPRIPSGA